MKSTPKINFNSPGQELSIYRELFTVWETGKPDAGLNRDKTLLSICLLEFLWNQKWSWGESNPCPNEEATSFLHA